MPVIYGQFITRRESTRTTLGDPEQYPNKKSSQTTNRQEGSAGVDVYAKQEDMFSVHPRQE